MAMLLKKIKLKSREFIFLKKIIVAVLLIIIFVNIGSVVASQKNKYFTSNYWQNFPSLEKLFLSSQYVNKHPVGWIPDQTAFSYAGGKLIKGTSPILVVPDAPPLGKYLIGISAVIFNNDSTVILISAILSLFLLYLLSLQVFSSKMLALLPPFLLSFEPIFKNQLIYTPLLDLFQLVFILGTFYFFNKALIGKKTLFFFTLASLFLGFFISTKFFISGLTIVAAWYIVLFFKRDKQRIIKLSLTIPLAVITLLASYVRVFAFGYSLHKFLGIQKWVFLYHSSQLILPFSVWPLLLFNQWHVWFGDKPVITDGQWSITWPILTIVSLVTVVLYILKKIPKNHNLEVLMAWFLVYMCFLSFGEIFSRYFVILIPILYIIFIYGLVSVLTPYFKKFYENRN